MTREIIPYGKQSISEEDIEAVNEVLRSDFLTTGPKIAEFEKILAQYVGSKYAVAVSSGTAALHLACLAADLKSGDELITSPMTFAASANCAVYCGANPVFADITPQGLINPEKIEELITSKTKILIPVHYSGLPCEMEIIKEIAQKNNLIIIEDSCHALGAQYKNSRIGDCTYSDMSVFSFHAVKHITTAEGGIITTNSHEFYRKLKMLRTHGITKDPSLLLQNDGPWYHEMQMLGYNYRLSDLQCALGIAQMQRIQQFVERRRKLAETYDSAFSESDEIQVLREGPNQRSSYHLYPILVKDAKIRKKLFEKLRAQDIWVQVHYIPVYWHPFYQNLGFKKGICPHAENFYHREISVPMYPGMTDDDQNYVIKTIFDIVATQ